MTTLRDADVLVQTAVETTVAALTLRDEDAGAVRLAREYARIIDLGCDNADILEKLGPKLLACLESLGATPAARARITKGAPLATAPTQLAKLRAARR